LDIVPDNNSIENTIPIPISISDQIKKAQLMDVLINRACADNNIESQLSPNPSWTQVFSFLQTNNLVKLESSLESKVTNGDIQAISQLLSLIVDTLDEGGDENQIQEEGDNINNENNVSKDDENKKSIDIQQKRLKSNPNLNKNDDLVKNKVVLTEEKPQPNLNLNSLDPKKNLDTSESMLEFVILLSCQKFTIVPKQAASLLSNNFKLLAQILIQGLKGDFN